MLAGACATYQPAPIDPTAAAAAFQARRLDDPQLRERVAALLPAPDPWPPARWNRAQLLAVALTLNPNVAVARAQVESALAHETTAGQRPNPELTLQSEYAHDEPHPWLYGLSLDLLLRTSERRQLEVDAARLETSGARFDLMDRAWAVRRALIDALARRERAQREAELLRRLGDAQARKTGIVKRRVAAGEEAAETLLVAGQAGIEIEQRQAQARADAAQADAALAAALGVPLAALQELHLQWREWGAPPDVAADALAAARSQALRARSDLAAAIAGYGAAEARLHRAVLQQYPQFHLSPGYYWDHGIAKFPLETTFELPLFNRNQGAIAEARAARALAGRRMLAVQADAIGAIDAAVRAEQLAADAVATAGRAFDAARVQRRNAALNLRLGAIGAGEDLDAAILELRSELELLQQRAQWQAARDALEDALHAPLSGPELQLAQPLPVAITGVDR